MQTAKPASVYWASDLALMMTRHRAASAIRINKDASTVKWMRAAIAVHVTCEHEENLKNRFEVG